MRLNIHVIDDDERSRWAILNSLKSPDWKVYLHATEAEYLKDRERDQPSCLILELNLPGGNGLDFQRRLLRSRDEPTVIFVTKYGTIPSVVQAMKQGAIEFLTKPVSPTLLLAAVQQAHSNEVERWQKRELLRTRQEQLASLTQREKDVFLLVVSGNMNKVIATKLGITETTVKVHRRHLMRKFSTNNVATLVRISEMLGIKTSSKSAK